MANLFLFVFLLFAFFYDNVIAIRCMSTRSNFVKSELQKIYNNLNMSYEYVDYSRMENDNKFIKVFELLMEISEKSNTLNKAVRGNYLFI